MFGARVIESESKMAIKQYHFELPNYNALAGSTGVETKCLFKKRFQIKSRQHKYSTLNPQRSNPDLIAESRYSHLLHS